MVETPLAWSALLGASMLAYLGPETVMPVTSLLAAIVGFLLLAWQRVIHWIRAPFAWLSSRTRPDATPPDAAPPRDTVERAGSERDAGTDT